MRDFLSSRRTRREIVSFLVLVSVGAALRVALADLPNFAPVAALALFSGYFFRSRLVAMAVPLSVMAVSDLVIGGYAWQMMMLVYGMLAFPVALRSPLRRYLALRPERPIVGPVLGLVTCSLGAALAFFLVTNFGAWIWFDTYQPGWAGLWQSYVAAVPFFRYTLLGDLLFGTMLFGSYAVIVHAGWIPDPAAEPA